MTTVESIEDSIRDTEVMVRSWKKTFPLLEILDKMEGCSVFTWFYSEQLFILTDRPEVVGLLLAHGAEFKEKKFIETTGQWTYYYYIGPIKVSLTKADQTECPMEKIMVDIPASQKVIFRPLKNCDPFMVDMTEDKPNGEKA